MATLIDVIEQVRSRVSPSTPEELLQKFDFAIEQAVPSALKEVAIKVAKSKDDFVKTQLQKDFALALTAGTTTVATMTSSAEPALLEFPFVSVRHSSISYPLQPVPSYLRLQIEPTNPDLGFYTLRAGTLYTKDTAGSLTGLTGTLTVTAQYVPLLSLLPPTLLPLLVEEIVLALKGISFEPETESLLESYPTAVSGSSR